MRLLVAYAGEHGSTQSIARRIAARLSGEVTALPADEVRDVTRWDAAVIGSAVHDRRWLDPAVELVTRAAPALAARHVWLFSVGMSAALGRPLRAWAHRASQHYVDEFRDSLRPHDHHVFTGIIEPEHLSPVGNVLFRLCGGSYGDHRSWDDVDGWAAGIDAALLAIERATRHQDTEPPR